MRTLLSVCALSLLLTACGPRQPLLVRPSPPREAMVLCPDLPLKPSQPTDDDNAVWEAEMIDWAVACGVPHNRLVRWLLENP